MHILGLIAENVKKIRVVEIEPKGRLIQITGKNDQGKTSVLDAIWWGLVGKRALPEKPVRKGAEKARIRLDLGELHVTRTIRSDGAMTLNVESGKGSKFSSPQQVLDELLGELTFDPLSFIRMKPKQQIEALRSVVKIDLNTDEINQQNTEDFAKRRDINRDIDRLRVEANTIIVQSNLPKDKVDDQPILEALQSAGDRNREAQAADTRKREATALVEASNRTEEMLAGSVKAAEQRIKQLQNDLLREQNVLDELTVTLENQAIKTQKLINDEAVLPAGEFVDVSKLTTDLQQAQLINREIDKRVRREKLETDLKEKEKSANALTRAMEDREEKKRKAMADVKMPVPGLTFDEETVLFNSIPLSQLSNSEQIRLSTSIAMAANPTLRIIRIDQGEALDEDALAMLGSMAEEKDFQVWISRVDSSGKVGIVIEDGTVKDINE